MKRNPLLIAVLPVLLALAFLMAGCGGDDDESSSDEAPAAATTTAESSEEAASGGSLENCKEFQTAASQVGQQFAAATSGAGDVDLQKAADAFDELADKAPSEVRADFQTINEAFGTLAEALEGVDLSSGKTPDPETLAKLQTALAAIDQAKVNAASTRISAWAQKNCKA